MWYGHLARHRPYACATNKTSERSTLYMISLAEMPQNLSTLWNRFEGESMIGW